mmetsp:Transcript_15141/g.25256  ORF Transcript_15141/g.25256 Transcript_15141/m.25256 type:complete len:499 (-) Transcript_15141:249-1745(-)
MPWFLAVMGGRINLDPETYTPNYRGRPKLNPPDNFNLWMTGVSISSMVHVEAYVMLFTSLTYLLVQVPGMMYLHETREVQAAGERTFAFLGAALCVCFFCGYLYLQYLHSKTPDGRQQQARDEFVRNAIAQKKVTLLGVMLTEYKAEIQEQSMKYGSYSGNGTSSTKAKSYSSPYHKGDIGDANGSTATSTSEATNLISSRADFSHGYTQRLRSILRPFFKAYDVANENSLNMDELRVLFDDLGESLTKKEVSMVFARFDKDGNGRIDYEEFVQGVCDYMIKHKPVMEALAYKSQEPDVEKMVTSVHDGGANDEDDDEDEEEEEDDIPSDMRDLSPAEQQARIKWRAFYMMGLGTAIVILISDPMVDVLDEIGKRSGIPSFYVAFVLAPMASNASELVAAYNYAQKKTKASISISMATLLGAAIMNNTFVLGIFMLLVATQGLSWEFFAETLTILLVQFAMGYFALKSMHTMADAFMILSLYPLSLALVWFLEANGWD